MASTYALTGNYYLSFAAQLIETWGTGTAQNTVVDALIAGTTSFPALKNQLTDGNAANQAHQFWHDCRSVAGSANDDLDLNGGTMTNVFGVTVTMTKVAWVLLKLVTPAVGVRVVVGNAASNAWTAWFGAQSHTEECRDTLFKVNQIDQWTVDSTHKTLRINNPTGSAISYHIAILGS